MSNTSSSSASVIEVDAMFPAQDYVLIGNDRSPGKAEILDTCVAVGWDERQGYALSGGTLIPTGTRLGTFKVKFSFWDPASLPTWYTFAAKYFDRGVVFAAGTKTPRALGIYHPQLAAPPLRIVSVVVEGSTGLTQDGKGIWSATISFREYRMPTRAPAAPAAAVIPGTSTEKPTALEAADTEIQEKFAQYQNLWNSY